MIERLPQEGVDQVAGEAPLQTMSMNAEPSLLEQYEAVKNFHGGIDVQKLIDKLMVLQEIQHQAPKLLECITEINECTEEAEGIAISLEQESQKIKDAIQAARSRVDVANIELEKIRIGVAALEDEIDELDSKLDDESVRKCNDRRRDLEKLRGEKELQRTIKQIQNRAITELETKLGGVQVDVEIEQTTRSRSLTHYKNQEVLLRRRLEYVTLELGKLASAATIIVASIDNLAGLPSLRDVSDEENTPVYQLPDNGSDVWLEATPAVRSIPVYFEIVNTSVSPEPEPEPEQILVEDGLLPYRHIYQGLLHERPSVTSRSNRSAVRIVTNSNKK